MAKCFGRVGFLVIGFCERDMLQNLRILKRHPTGDIFNHRGKILLNILESYAVGAISG